MGFGVGAAGACVAGAPTAAVALSSGGGQPAVGSQEPQAGLPQPSPSTTAPGATSPPPGGGATGSPPETGLVYQQLKLPPGHGVSLRSDPPTVGSGTYSGDFGLTADATAFTVDRSRDTLALIDAGRAGTAATCQSSNAVDSVQAAALGTGTRLCVRSADGTVTAMVTFRQLPTRQNPDAAAVFDVTVWHEVTGRSAPGTGISADYVN
jgi:hypothetical protein